MSYFAPAYGYAYATGLTIATGGAFTAVTPFTAGILQNMTLDASNDCFVVNTAGDYLVEYCMVVHVSASSNQSVVAVACKNDNNANTINGSYINTYVLTTGKNFPIGVRFIVTLAAGEKVGPYVKNGTTPANAITVGFAEMSAQLLR